MEHSNMRSIIGLSSSLLLVSGLFAGCVVPEARYDEARSATRVEQEANRRTQARLVELSRELDLLHAQLATREKELEKRETDLSQANLDADVARGERQYALELVEQLRAELGRTGDHLRSFAADRAKLAQALDAAELRAKRISSCEQDAADNAAVIRDLALLLHEPITTGDVELALVEGRAVLRFPESEMSGESPGPIGQKVVAAVTRVASLHAESRIRLSEAGARDDVSGAAERLKQVSDVLEKQGVAPDRIELRPGIDGAEQSAPEPTLEIAVFVDAAPVGAAPEADQPH
jgi:hypothetical protein